VRRGMMMMMIMIMMVMMKMMMMMMMRRRRRRRTMSPTMTVSTPLPRLPVVVMMDHLGTVVSAPVSRCILAVR
jgi:hypothetical protein